MLSAIIGVLVAGLVFRPKVAPFKKAAIAGGDSAIGIFCRIRIAVWV